MKSKRFLLVAVALGLLALSFVSTASAKDDIVATSVTALTGPSPLIVDNGLPPGTIHVRYTYIGFTFPSAGVFASVTLNLAAQAGSGNGTTNYGTGIPLNLAQNPAQQQPGRVT